MIGRGLPLSLVLMAGLLGAACGGAAAGGGPEPAAPETPSGSSPVTGPAPSASAPAAVTGNPTAPTASATAPAPVEMKSPLGTGMQAELQALGLDPKNLPPIEKLDPKALRGAMKLIARSLGARCGDCHTEGDFAAPTPRKKIAAKMWDEFVVKMALQDGSPLFCDSCHQGRIKLLDRSDKKALGKWMDASFVMPIKRSDGKSQECESCHVDWNMRFLSSWAR